MKILLLIFIVGSGILILYGMQWTEAGIASIIIYFLGARVAWLLLLRKRIWIWGELVTPGELKYRVAYAIGFVWAIYTPFLVGPAIMSLIT